MTLDSTIIADTPEELAEKLDMDKDVFAATIERYNALCDAGNDEDFGKPAEFKQKPECTLYAIPLTRSFTVTFDGLVTDTPAENNIPIPGIYAAGEVAFTDLFSDEYSSCGLAIGASLRYGRIAGVNAAAGN